MQLSQYTAKQAAAGVWAVAFTVLVALTIAVDGMVDSGIVVFAAVIATFVVAPAVALAVYFRLGGSMKTLLEALGRPDASQRSEDTEPTTMTRADSLATLRERYAQGDLTDAEFEQKVERLLQTDSPEHAAEWRERTREPIAESN